MMQDMMKQCCDASGKPDFEHMMKFMEQCGKGEFTAKDIQMMKDFCAQGGQPQPEEMKQFMEKCGCHVT